MESNEDDFQSITRQKSKLRSKRRNKLSSKHRSKSQKSGDGNNKEDYDLFSPVSCTLSRKKSRTEGESGVIIVSDGDSNDNFKAIIGNSETTKDKVESENNSSETDNFIRNEQLHDYVEHAILPDDHAEHFNKYLSGDECKKEENKISSLVRQNENGNRLKTVGVLDTSTRKAVENSESSLSLKCSTPCSSSTDKNSSPKILTINSCEGRKLEHSDEDFEKLHDISEFSKKLNRSPLSSFSVEFGFSESVDTGVPSTIKADLEEKNKKSEDSETFQDSNHPIEEVVFSNLHNTSEEEREQNKFYEKGIEDAAFYPESRIRSLSLEHLNDSTPDNIQGNISEIKSEVHSEKINTSEVPSVPHDDSKKLTYSCPLCWKIFETSKSQMVHMKECAARHNLSTRQLLDALELQDKQSAERSALGLPEIPSACVVKKSTAKRKTGARNDSNLQLALALSVSLQEAEDKEQFQEDKCLIKAGLGHEVVERQKTMLERFGFTNSRPALPSTSTRPKQGNKNKNKNTVLTQRTKEERERLITEKVAIILIGEENNTSSSASNENVQFAEHPLGVMNCLQKYETKSNSLWSAVTTSCDEEQNHYVNELSNRISPCKVKAGEKIKHLSQIPCRNVTPKRTEVVTSDKEPYLSTSSQENEQSRKESQSLSTESKTRQSLQSFFAEKDTSNRNLAETLVSDWRAILNKKTMSDVKIFVESEQEIPGHRLVFYARCRSILKDIIIEKGPEKSTAMLMWTNISYRAALAFLQFIYCGLTSKILRLDKNDMLAVKELAQMYHVTELLNHLKVMSRDRAKVSKHSSSNSPQFHRSGTPSKSLSPWQYEHSPQKSYQNDITEFPRHYSESLMLLPEQSSPLKKDTPLLYSPSKDHSEQDEHKCMTPSQKIFELNLQSPSHISPKSQSFSKSRHISEDDIISSKQSLNIVQNSTQEINKVHTSPISSKTKTEIGNNSSSSRLNTDRSTSPDLFMEEENEENTQSTFSRLSQESGVDIRHLLALFDVCLTQNGQQKMSQQKSPVKSNPPSPVLSQNKKSSPVLVNKTLSSRSLDERLNNNQETAINRSKSPLEHAPKSNNSKHETNKLISSSLSLDTHIEQHTSAEQLQFKSKHSKAKDFDCIDFLENLISDSPPKAYNKDMESGGKRTSTDSKRRYSERDSSSESCRFGTKKLCRESLENELSLKEVDSNKSELNYSKNGENNIIDTLDLTQNSDESDNPQPCATLSHKANNSHVGEPRSDLEENHLITMQDDICNRTNSENEPELLTDTEVKLGTLVTRAIEKASETDDKQHQDEWDSFDEMCNASEPEIFSQGLHKLLSSQSTSNSEKHGNKNSLPSKSHKQISNSTITSKHGTNNQSYQKSNNKVSLEDTFVACLNESILWKDENEPTLKSSSKDRKSALRQEHNKYYKTPTQQKNVNTEDVTPPANYSAMKTPELKKELDRFGLKPSLTKKQAKIMLRYIYDQLHPFITVSDSEDSTEGGDSVLSRSPFKIPDKNTRVPKSPTKKVNSSGTSSSLGSQRKRQNPISVRRSLASQIDTGSDCDELSSQESSSSSTIDVAEEMLVDDLEALEKEIAGSQDVCSLDILPSVVQRYITGNPELHQKVLQHEPIWLEEFLNDLKSQNHKFKKDNLMDYFDEQCITFRTIQGHKSRLKRRQRKEAKKNKSPAKKKGKLSRTKSAATQNSASSSN